jgi:four helix bundle protein
MFCLEKLKVYDKALTHVAALAQLSAAWDKRHAVVDQLMRASESLVLNIAEGARLRGIANRQHVGDYAIGSALECAACLDIAGCKQFLTLDQALSNKQPLCEIVRMLVGLRKSWAGDELHEPPADYEPTDKPLFGHERLDAYRVGLQFVGWFHQLPGGSELSSRRFRQIDKATTSLVLNIAEGNGRCLQADRRAFFDTAESASVKAAAHLELSERTGEVNRSQLQTGMALLNRIAGLVHGLVDFTRNSDVIR